MKKRILIDARMVGPVGHGIALYVRQLAEALAAIEKPYEVTYLLAPDCPQDSVLRLLDHAESRVPFLHLSELWKLGSEIAMLEPALYHTPSFASLLSYPCPHVQTVHDLNHLAFGGLAQKLYYQRVLRPSMEKASALLTVSESAALEIREWLLHHRIDRSLEVAPNPIEEFPLVDDASALARFGLSRGEFFLAVGNEKAHKNLPLLERAYRAAASVRELPPLVLTTPGVSAKGIHHLPRLSEHELGALLRQARCLYSPSLYEGFGRPPVEAALAGTVPVASSLAVHREALAGVSEAIFLDPADESQWKESFLRMANEWQRVGQASQAWIRKTWSKERLGKKMDEVYRRCLEEI